MNKLGKSWDEIVKLANNNRLKDSSDSLIIIHRIENEDNCKKDQTYLDKRKRVSSKKGRK